MSSDKTIKELKHVAVKGLNGFLDHTVDLKENGITILHGPNGCGKTTLLDMIMHFYNNRFGCLSRIDFKEFTITHDILVNEKIIQDEFKITRIHYDNSKVQKIDNSNKNIEIFTSLGLSFSRLTGCHNNGKSFEIGLFQDDSSMDEEIYHLNRMSHNNELRKINYRNKVINSRNENFEFFFEGTESSRKLISTVKNSDLVNIEKFIDSFNFFMVKTQRLIYMPSEKEKERSGGGKFSNLMIQRYAKDISQKIASSLADSNEKTDFHNKSFPERLIQNINDKNITVESEQDIRKKYKETQDKITNILNAGLLFREKNIALPDETLTNENVKTVLSLYLDDLNEKLSVYDDLLKKIEAFQEIVGGKFRNKEMKVHYEKGFYFHSKYGDKRELNLLELSSGEQHQIVLFYELIFLADSGTYYLIDEPEISLHVDWQRSFLDDISRVEKLRGHKFIIATHSPQIIGSHRSLCVALDGGIL